MYDFNDISHLAIKLVKENKDIREEIKNSFIEFNYYDCPFRDCSHTKEEECIIKEKVRDKEILEERYNDYIKFIEKR